MSCRVGAAHPAGACTRSERMAWQCWAPINSSPTFQMILAPSASQGTRHAWRWAKCVDHTHSLSIVQGLALFMQPLFGCCSLCRRGAGQLHR